MKQVIALAQIILAMGAVSAQAAEKGNIGKGQKIAEKHCTRCHVVGSFNPGGGISSTPSFQLLVKRRPDYKERFATNDARCAAADPRCVTNPEVPKYLYYPSYTRHDLAVNYDMAMQGGTNLNIFGGVRNMFDKDPFVPRTGDAYEGGIGNFDSKFGGGIGRFYYVGAEMRFGG